VQIMITVGRHYGHLPPILKRGDLSIMQHYEPLPITNLISLRGARATLELFLLVDDWFELRTRLQVRRVEPIHHFSTIDDHCRGRVHPKRALAGG